MNLAKRVSLVAALCGVLIPNINAQQTAPSTLSLPTGAANNTRQSPTANTIALLTDDEKDKKTRKNDKLPTSDGKPAAEAASTIVTVDSTIFGTMMQVLVTRGIISNDEARAIGANGNAVEQRNRLASTLFERGVISATDYAAIVGTSGTATPAAGLLASQDPRSQIPPSQKPSEAPPAPNRAPPPFIPAVAPNRPLQLEATKRDGIVPDIKLGGTIKLKLNGFLKSSVVYDSTNPGGNDIPALLLATDTGPKTAGEFRVKARAIRIGATLEGLDPSPKTAIIGRFEFDFEGNYNVGGNSIRNPNPRLRIGYIRIDHKYADNTSFFALFGQDWTPFLSSTLSNSIETTNLGLNFGNPYDRLPQARLGFDHNFGGARKFHIGTEIAFVLPKYGITQNFVGSGDLATQLSIGEREGTDSRRPEIQGRVVAQFQLDGAQGVQPAQIIGSFMQGQRRAIATAANVPAAFKSAFPSGAEVTSDRYGFSAEATLPTRFATLSLKYYNGSDLASFSAGEGLTIFNDTFGLTGVTAATTLDNRSISFGFLNGQPVVAPQRSVRAQGIFAEVGVPLSRLFDANPKGRWAGFDANFHYSFDEAKPRDARAAGSNRGKSDWAFGNLRYRLNNFITFAYEQSYYRTRAINNSPTDFRGLPLLRGIPARSSHDNRSEFATIFTF
ncbi:MAG: hypothetical protein NVSMB56_00930 [Pyrinomonadaceae bacterium]